MREVEHANGVSKDLSWVRDRLEWMEQGGVWPNGQRYLWTDAFGVVLLASVYEVTQNERYLERAKWVVDEVDRVLGRARGIRIGEQPDRDGQYYHYLMKWAYALTVMANYKSVYRDRALELVTDIHEAFVVPSRGVHWKMTEDLTGRYPGYGWGAIDAFDGYVVYRLVDSELLSEQIKELKRLVDFHYRQLHIKQDLGLGMMLWLTHFFPSEPWAKYQQKRCFEQLDQMWVEPPGYFCRYPGGEDSKFQFTNYGASLGLQATHKWPKRVDKLQAFFDDYRSGDEYDKLAITHVMASCSHFPGYLLRWFGQEE
jgi:hypothetical protein